MTALTVVGVLSDALGHAEHRSVRMVGNVAVEHRSYQALASVEYRSAQPSRIPVRRQHGGDDVGRTIHLERSESGSIVAVTEVTGADDLLLHGPPVYWSPELLYRGAGTDIVITELVFTSSPATVGLPALEILGGDVRQAAEWVRARRRPDLTGLLDRAAAADRRGTRVPIVIAERSGRAEGRGAYAGVPIERRPAGAILSVR